MQGVLTARTELHKDMLNRYVINVDPFHKRVWAIAALLHPAFKDNGFITAYDFIPASDTAWALSELRSEWKFSWKNKPLTTEVGGLVD